MRSKRWDSKQSEKSFVTASTPSCWNIGNASRGKVSRFGSAKMTTCRFGYNKPPSVLKCCWRQLQEKNHERKIQSHVSVAFPHRDFFQPKRNSSSLKEWKLTVNLSTTTRSLGLFLIGRASLLASATNCNSLQESPFPHTLVLIFTQLLLTNPPCFKLRTGQLSVYCFHLNICICSRVQVETCSRKMRWFMYALLRILPFFFSLQPRSWLKLISCNHALHSAAQATKKISTMTNYPEYRPSTSFFLICRHSIVLLSSNSPEGLLKLGQTWLKVLHNTIHQVSEGHLYIEIWGTNYKRSTIANCHHYQLEMLKVNFQSDSPECYQWDTLKLTTEPWCHFSDSTQTSRQEM